MDKNEVVYNNLIKLGGIDMNKDINQKEGNELLMQGIANCSAALLSFPILALKYFIIVVTIVKTLQWLGVI